MENENQFNNAQQNPAAGNPQPTNVDFGADIQRFFAEDLKDMFVATVVRPMNGVRRWLEETRSKSFVNPLCTVVLSFLLAALLPFLVFAIKGAKPSFGDCLTTFGLLPVFYAVFFTIFMFIVLAIKQKPDILFAFRNSAIHVFLMTLAIILISLIGLVIDETEILAFNFASLKFGMVLILLVVIYAFSLGISGVRQVLSGLSAKEGEDRFSWYISPLVIMLSLWLTMLVVGNM